MKIKKIYIYQYSLFIVLLLSLLPIKIGNFSASGFGWIIILLLSFIQIIAKKISAPLFRIWIVWLLYLIIRLILDFNFYALQYTLQICAPIIFGLAVSGCSVMENDFEKVIKNFKSFAIIFWLLQLIKIFFSDIPGGSLVMTDTVYCTIYICCYFYTRENKNIFGYFLFLLNQVLSITRTPVLLSLFAIPLSLKKISLVNKVIYLFGFLLLLIGLFYTPIFQEKMFFSGSGELSDLSFSNPNIRTSGRSTIWALHLSKMDGYWFFGHGSRTSYFLMKDVFKTILEPHNDYIRIIFEYGILGLSVFLLSLLIQYRKLKALLKKTCFNSNSSQILGKSALVLLILFCGFMATDNVIQYALYYNYFLFFIIGLFYRKIHIV